jgi:hypothetical protein
MGKPARLRIAIVAGSIRDRKFSIMGPERALQILPSKVMRAHNYEQNQLNLSFLKAPF